MDDDIYSYQPLWGNWYIELPIGKGSFGSVYRISREEMGRKYTSAVKFITVPNDEQRKEAEASLGDDEDTLTEYFGDIVRNIVGEIDMLYALSGNTNIISYQDHEVRKRRQGIGWDILIRMEYVTSLRKYLKERSMTVAEVVRLGIDICTALEVCSKKGIIHRDIKDENIFVSDDGVFKLGDFGIARELSKSGRAASMRGTPLYMAPEIFRGEKYDAAVDIYSLGIVLYKLLNNGRMPFMPPYPEKVRYQDSEDALEMRMSGAELPPPQLAGGLLAKVVLKACAYRAEERYASPGEMKRELENVFAAMSETEKKRPVGAAAEKTDDTAAAQERYESTAGKTSRETGKEGTIWIFPQGPEEAKRSTQHEKLDRTVVILPGEQFGTEQFRTEEESRTPQGQYENSRSGIQRGSSGAERLQWRKKPNRSGPYLVVLLFVSLLIVGAIVIRQVGSRSQAAAYLSDTTSISTEYEPSTIAPATYSRDGMIVKNGVLTEYAGAGYEIRVTIPDDVISIGDYAFAECEELSTVIISSSVTSIGNGAFSKCSNLSSITIPNGVQTIGVNAFSYCSGLASVIIPVSVETLGNNVFSNCTNLVTVTTPFTLTAIGDNAFLNCCDLLNIQLQENVTSIGECAFYGCSNLSNLTIPGSVQYIGDHAFGCCPNLTIWCTAGSYAEEYAKENGISYSLQ